MQGVLNSSIEKGCSITKVQLLMFKHTVCQYNVLILQWQSYVNQVSLRDIVGKRVSKVFMYLKHVRCDKTWNYIASEN